MKDLLATIDSIRATRTAAPKTGCGVYFLFDDDNVVYVGQSVEIAARIGQHAKTKGFDSYAWIAVPEELLDAVEQFYITTLQPPLNKINQRQTTERIFFTERVVSSLTSRGDDSWIWDTEVIGLGIRHAKRGLRYFVRYRNNSNRQRKLKLGDVGKITVSEARYLAAKAMSQAAAGSEVSEYKKSQRTERKIWLG